MIYSSEWELIDQGYDVKGLFRLKVPGGWLVRVERGTEITFFPDQDHSWELKK